MLFNKEKEAEVAETTDETVEEVADAGAATDTEAVEEVIEEEVEVVEAAEPIPHTPDCYYTNSTGTYRWSRGKLYNDNDEKVSAREVSSRNDPLRKSDAEGNLLAQPFIIDVKPNV